MFPQVGFSVNQKRTVLDGGYSEMNLGNGWRIHDETEKSLNHASVEATIHRVMRPLEHGLSVLRVVNESNCSYEPPGCDVRCGLFVWEEGVFGCIFQVFGTWQM